MDAENLTAGQHECEAIRELEKYDIEVSTEHNGTWGFWAGKDFGCIHHRGRNER